MPFLRFARDRRGYETTVLMHAFREHDRAQPRILYWFRSPIDAKVGRRAIDEEAIRLIEEHHPDVSFDWARILESRAVTQADSGRTATQRRPTEQRTRPRQAGTGESESATASPAAAQSTPAPAERPAERRKPRRRRAPQRDAAAASDAETPAARATEAAEPGRGSAAEEAFSPQDLTRLRGRHAALLARIDRSAPDAAQAAALREAAEALNPDSWVTREDVGNAVEHYESAYRALLDALGPRQRIPG